MKLVIVKPNKMMPPNNNDFIENIGETIGYIEIFAERKIQLAKLEAAEKMAKTTASLATGFILLALVPVFLCVLSVAIGFLLVQSFELSFASSFFILSGFYLLLGIFLFTSRRHFITNPILEKVIKDMFQK